MDRRRLGRTDVEVSTIGLGCAPLGNLYAAVDEQTARATVDAAWQGGIRYFDTAPHYGIGLSEQRLGAALRDRPRGEYVISTKVGRLLDPNPNPTGIDSEGFQVPDSLVRTRDYSRAGVLRSISDSHRRLGLDRIDVVLVHDPEDYLDQAITSAIPALIELREQGVIGAVGVGMNLVGPLRRVVAETDVDVVMIAGRWTLLDRSAAPLLADCGARGVSVLAAAPYNTGLLARQQVPDDAPFDYGAAPAAVLRTARRMAERCAAHGVTLPGAAVQFASQDAAVAAVVAGARNTNEVDSLVRSAAMPLPASLWTELDMELGSELSERT